MEQKKKWMVCPILGAVLLIVLGLLLIFKSGVIVNLIPLILGFTMIVIGVFQIAYYIGIRDYLVLPSLKLTSGIVNILLGLIFCIKNDRSLEFLGIFFGIWALVTASIRLNLTIQKKLEQFPYIWDVVATLIQLIFALFLIFNPFHGFAIWAVYAGCFCIIEAIIILGSLIVTDQFRDD